ncbi:hypothetical protein ACFPN0_20760 [Kitasatospora cinereorecta]
MIPVAFRTGSGRRQAGDVPGASSRHPPELSKCHTIRTRTNNPGQIRRQSELAGPSVDR